MKSIYIGRASVYAHTNTFHIMWVIWTLYVHCMCVPVVYVASYAIHVVVKTTEFSYMNVRSYSYIPQYTYIYIHQFSNWTRFFLITSFPYLDSIFFGGACIAFNEGRRCGTADGVWCTRESALAPTKFVHYIRARLCERSSLCSSERTIYILCDTLHIDSKSLASL